MAVGTTVMNFIYFSMANKNPKRPLDNDTDSDSDNTVNSWPRFLIIEGTDVEKPLNKLSVFALHKGIQGLAGTPKSAKMLRSGALLVEVSKPQAASNLLKTTTLVQCPVKVSAHKSLNSCRGVIRCPEIKNETEEDILQNLSSQGVTHVKKMTVVRNGVRIPTGTVFLTFAGTNLPTSIKVAYMVVRVDLYIPNPVRCFKCQKYGHFSNNCRHTETCDKCGNPTHEGDCTEIKCINCKGQHAASSRNCPMWLEEKEIQAIKVRNNISYIDAKKRFSITKPQNGSYAAVVSKTNKSSVQTTSVACQTNLTWVEIKWSQPREIPQKATPAITQTVPVNIEQKSESESIQQKSSVKSKIPVVGRSGTKPDLPPKPTSSGQSSISEGKKSQKKQNSSGQRSPKTSDHLLYNKYQTLQDLDGEEDMQVVADSQPPSPARKSNIIKLR